MAIETTAAGGALIKLFGVPVLAGAAATSLGFMFMWPQSTREAFIRFFSSIIISTFIGPALVAAVLSWWPSLFDSAKTVAGLYGGDPATGFLFIAAPLMVAACPRGGCWAPACAGSTSGAARISASWRQMPPPWSKTCVVCCDGRATVGHHAVCRPARRAVPGAVE